MDCTPHKTSRTPDRPRLLALVLAMVMALALTSCASGTGAGDDSGPIKIGILWPFNGAYSNYGPDGLAGTQLALQEAGMKVAGRPVELVKASEDVLDPANTLREAKRLVQQEGVTVVIGPVFGSSQQAVAAYFKTTNVMAFVPFGNTKELAGRGNFIGWSTLDTSFSTPLGGYLADELHYQSIATLAPDYVYGHNVLVGATQTFTKAGGKVVQQQWVPLGTTDLLPYASNLDRDADALVMWLVPQDAASFVKSFRSLGIKMPIIFVNGVFDPTFQSMGANIVGSLGIVDWSAGLTNKANKAFVADFAKANKGQVPNNQNAAAYVDTKLALATIEKAGGAADFERLKKAVVQVRLDTPYGPGHIDANFLGVTSRTIVKAVHQDGRYVWEPVKTFDNVPNEL
ncbi:ABC transporter substrate-binding protein [Intrasporangium sp.]|uniref:ABC transporter substrate-binding protein n=1 Tax=Intrasporangium sp. TaxID=1925024 RepID=UPI0032220DE0